MENLTSSLLIKVSNLHLIEEFNNGAIAKIPDITIGQSIDQFLTLDSWTRLRVRIEKHETAANTIELRFKNLNFLCQVDLFSNGSYLITGVRFHFPHSMEDMLLESFLLDQVEKAIIATDLQGNVIYWNAFATSLYGYAHDEAMGQNIVSLISTKMSAEQGNEIMVSLMKGHSWKGEYECLRKDGTSFIANVTDCPLKDESTGQLIGIVGISNDNTSFVLLRDSLQRQVEAKTRDVLLANKSLKEENEQRRKVQKELELLSLVAKRTSTAVVLVDKHEQIVWVNASYRKLTGFKSKELLGMKIFSLLASPDEADKVEEESAPTTQTVIEEDNLVPCVEEEDSHTFHLEANANVSDSAFVDECPTLSSSSSLNGIRTAIQKGRPFALHLSHQSQMGRKILVHLDWTPFDAQSLPYHVVLISDVEPARRLQMALGKAEAEKRSNQFKTHFLTTITHELRTPLNGIIGETSLLMESHLENAEVNDSLSLIMGSAKMLLNLINNLLDVQRIEQGKMQLDRVPGVSLFNVLAQTVSACKSMALLRDLEIELIVGNRLKEQRFITDPVRLAEVLLNLLSNALKYAKHSTCIKVQCDRWSQLSSMSSKSLTSDPIALMVEDTGPGIPEDKHDQLFRPFHQLGNVTHGSGLGLYICKEFATLMNGDIWFERVNGLTRFYFTFEAEGSPLTDLDELGRQTEPTLEPDLKFLSAIQVLVAEDNPVNQRIIIAMLRKLGVKCVSLARDGVEAVSLFENHSYDLIFMDILMPNMDGIEATKRIRSMLHKKQPIIVALTANATQIQREECENVNMNHHLTKPLTLEDLKRFLCNTLKENEILEKECK